MDHAVFADMKSKELEKLLKGQQTMIIRGAAGRRFPGGAVFSGDLVYFVRDLGKTVVVAKGVVKDCHRSDEKGKKALKLLADFREPLGLKAKEAAKWARRKHVLLVEFGRVDEVGPFAVEFPKAKGADWLSVDYINKIRID